MSVDIASRWDERIDRAHALAAAERTASEALTFYSALASHQKRLSLDWGRIENLDAGVVLPAIPEFLDWLTAAAPPQLARAVAQLRRMGRDEWQRSLDSYLAPDRRSFDDIDPAVVFVLEALLQPSAGLAGQRGAAQVRQENGYPVRCPDCSALPVVGVLREEGHGGRRTLVCALCLVEWEYHRVICPGCGQQEFDALPVYTAAEFDHVRIEACDKCRRYIKTIDLTKNGLAVPPVDDIASVALDLWARERGYVRLKANVLAL